MTAFNKIHDMIREAATSAQVAEIAEVDYSSWNHHVFFGRGQMIKGRNRGRLPFVEINLAPITFDQESHNLDMETIEFEIVISAGRGLYESTDSAQRILRAFLAELKRLKPILTWAVAVDAVEMTPWGSKTTSNIVVELSSPNDYNEDDI